MKDFEYVAAKSVEEVIACLAGNVQPVRLLSGGTDLLVQLREGRKQAAMVVDLKHVSELDEIRWEGEGELVIGAAVACHRLAYDQNIQGKYPGLVEAVCLIGGTQIQSRASVGGNLCNASPAADSIPALIVHRAICTAAGPNGRRNIPVETFCTGPGQNVLEPDEVLVSIRLPEVGAGFGAAYQRFIPRNEMDIAVVGAASSVQLDESMTRIVSARLALGAVAPTPLLVEEAGQFLQGKALGDDIVLEAARIAAAAARPIDDMRGTTNQRKHLSQVLARRTLSVAITRAQGSREPTRRNGHGV